MGSQESLLCPVRALKVCIVCSASYRKSEPFFVGFGNHTKGGPVTKQIISRWLVDSITLAYSSLGLQCPNGVRAHSTRGIASSWAWTSGVSILDWLVLAVHICKVLRPGCPCLAGQSPFCLSSNLMGSLDQYCLRPSFAWSVHTILTPGITYGMTPRPRMTLMAHPVLGVFYWLPCV